MNCRCRRARSPAAERLQSRIQGATVPGQPDGVLVGGRGEEGRQPPGSALSFSLHSNKLPAGMSWRRSVQQAAFPDKDKGLPYSRSTGYALPLNLPEGQGHNSPAVPGRQAKRLGLLEETKQYKQQVEGLCTNTNRTPKCLNKLYDNINNHIDSLKKSFSGNIRLLTGLEQVFGRRQASHGRRPDWQQPSGITIKSGKQGTVL